MDNKNDKKVFDDNIRLSDLNLPEDLKKLSLEQCRRLCREIRGILINTVSKTGGHLASNLGTVELTMAIHRVFNSPDDKIVWDVGHQAYTHKLLTGRLDRFGTLRQENGIAGFPRPSESEHDAFISGHSSTSISVACGIAEAMRISGNNENYAVAVVGDGAMTGGMIYEALNNGGKDRKNLIVILNHNNMSISKNVGALSKYLAKIRAREKYVDTKSAVEKVLMSTPVVGKPVTKMLKVSKDTIKSAIYHTTMFDDLGFIYLGPVDGHDQSELERVLYTAKKYKHPVFVHVNTVKGKGYMPAEKNPGEYHGISKFDIKTGNPEVSADESYSTEFGKELVRLAREDDRICAVTAAMKYATGLHYFASEFRERFFDVGIAEQHAVTFSAGLASMGYIPVFAVYSSFLQRAYDQIIHDAAICNMHIVIGVDRAGVVGEDGVTHQGIFDVPMLTTIPNTVIYSPSCYEELRVCLEEAVKAENGIKVVRYPKGKDHTGFDKSRICTGYVLERDNINRRHDVLMITYGRLFDNMCKARDMLKADGINADMLKLVKIFPLENEVTELVLKYKHIFFFEESYSSGSISEHLSSVLIRNGFKGGYSAVAICDFVEQATLENTLKHLHLDEKSMYNTVKENIKR